MQETAVEAKRREHAGAQKLVLQLDKKAGKRRRDADSQVRLNWQTFRRDKSRMVAKQTRPVESSCRAGANKLALQLDKKAGKRRRDADSQVRLNWHPFRGQKLNDGKANEASGKQLSRWRTQAGPAAGQENRQAQARRRQPGAPCPCLQEAQGPWQRGIMTARGVSRQQGGAGTQKLVLQLEKRAGKHGRDVDSQMCLGLRAPGPLFTQVRGAVAKRAEQRAQGACCCAQAAWTGSGQLSGHQQGAEGRPCVQNPAQEKLRLEIGRARKRAAGCEAAVEQRAAQGAASGERVAKLEADLGAVQQGTAPLVCICCSTAVETLLVSPWVRQGRPCCRSRCTRREPDRTGG